MKTYSSIWTDQLGRDIAQAAPKRSYSMSLVGEERQTVISAVNQGIDSHLEACFVPTRGDRYEFRTPSGIAGRVCGTRLECNVSTESLPVLVRRLMESGNEAAEALASDICQTLEIELI